MVLLVCIWTWKSNLFLVRQQSIRYFQFAEFVRFAGLIHAVGCRLDGVSQPPFDRLNLSRRGGDDTQLVSINRDRWRRATGGVHVYCRQNHGTDIRIVKRGIRNSREPVQTADAPADALITDVPGIRLLIQTADCQAVMLFDPEKRAVANIHCGWRGSVAGLIGQVVDRMTMEFGCNPCKMVAAIGPSLGPCCAEFVNYKTEIPQRFWRFRIENDHFDFWRISRFQLIEAGFAEKHIHHAGICTRCNSHLFYSYRAERRTGRFASLIGLE